jgi:hypothetical protein
MTVDCIQVRTYQIRDTCASKMACRNTFKIFRNCSLCFLRDMLAGFRSITYEIIISTFPSISCTTTPNSWSVVKVLFLHDFVYVKKPNRHAGGKLQTINYEKCCGLNVQLKINRSIEYWNSMSLVNWIFVATSARTDRHRHPPQITRISLHTSPRSRGAVK